MLRMTICNKIISKFAKTYPSAIAWVNGNEENPNLNGMVEFYETNYNGVIVCGEFYGLPENDSNFYGMHIHEFGDCTPPFDKTGNHYNPRNVEHPNHAGDMPPLLGNNGYAWTMFYDDRITIDEIINKALVIHSMRDDFTTQPSGDAGTKIGCGVIRRFYPGMY